MTFVLALLFVDLMRFVELLSIKVKKFSINKIKFLPISDPRTNLPHRLFNRGKNGNGFVQHKTRFCQPSRPLPG